MAVGALELASYLEAGNGYHLNGFVYQGLVGVV